MLARTAKRRAANRVKSARSQDISMPRSRHFSACHFETGSISFLQVNNFLPDTIEAFQEQRNWV